MVKMHKVNTLFLYKRHKSTTKGQNGIDFLLQLYYNIIIVRQE